MLEVKQLTKRFGGLIAVSELDLSVVEGQIVSLIGPTFSHFSLKYTAENVRNEIEGPKIQTFCPYNFQQ